MTRVLGIDCGSAATGYGMIDTDGRSSRVVQSGVILTGGQLSFPQRLKQISDGLRQLIQTYSPDVVAVEGIFYSVNANSALKLGQVRGVALLEAAAAELPVHEYSPLEIKSSVVGYGRAEKRQVQQMVKTLLGLKQVPPEDAADALAVALCHAHHSHTLRKLSRAQAGPVPSPGPAPPQPRADKARSPAPRDQTKPARKARLPSGVQRDRQPSI